MLELGFSMVQIENHRRNEPKLSTAKYGVDRRREEGRRGTSSCIHLQRGRSLFREEDIFDLGIQNLRSLEMRPQAVRELASFEIPKNKTSWEKYELETSLRLCVASSGW